MRVVSTVHKAGWDVYGERWLAGTENWPASTNFILYTEGFDLDHPRVEGRRIESVERAEAFKARYKHYKPVLWQWDVVRFCNKTFAMTDAVTDYSGLAVWLDADCITYKQLPHLYVQNLLPQGAYIAMFKRQGMATETGFWVVDCGNPQHQRFMDTWLRWYETDAFKQLNQWCDAATLDATVRMYEKTGSIKTVSLSGQYERDMHPMAKTDIAKYIDHLKGARKTLEASPENEHRSDASDATV